MLQYRAFRNDDPPAIAEIWRSHRPLRSIMQPMSTALLERQVLAKPYFDRHGLIVAVDDGHPVGFVHAGFGPNAELSALDYETGIVCMLMVGHHEQREQISDELLQHAESYLRDKGARSFQACGVSPGHPFYLGLYGGCQVPGVVESDEDQLARFQRCGYQVVDRRLILQRNLVGFRPPVDRQQMQIRRAYNIEAKLDPRTTDWWSACTVGLTDRMQFGMHARSGGPAVATATFWDMEPLASGWGVHAMGLLDLWVDHAQPMGASVFVLGEALRQMQSSGVTLVEVQLPEEDTDARRPFDQLGFEQTDCGLVMSRDGD